MLSHPTLLLALAATVSATRLYVSSYAGNITTLDLTRTNETYKLSCIETNSGCSPNASWLQLDVKHQNLFCLDEGITTENGTLNSFKINPKSGSLTRVNSTVIPGAPVNSAIYTGANGTQLLAVAHYAWALCTWTVNPATAVFKWSQAFNFTMSKPGPKAARQAAPHPHQVLLDPQNKYFVVPDLGADLVRVYYIDPKTLLISSRPNIPVLLGSGPRHGVFRVTGNRTEYYLAAELDSIMTGFNVEYLPNNGGLHFIPFEVIQISAPSPTNIWAGNAPAEIALAPGGKEVIVSNRNATVFNIANPDPTNSTHIPSDSMATFALSDGKKRIGSPEFSPAGGSFPRRFSLNHDGSLVAIGLQLSGRVVIYERDRTSGKLGSTPVADFEGLGPVTSVVWAKKGCKEKV